MANYNWTALDDGDTIDFDPFVDVLNVNSASISAAEMDITATFTSVVLSFGSKTITLLMDCRRVTTSNITFSDGSMLIIGDNTTGIVNDGEANTLNGGSGDDHLSGRLGNDSLLGSVGGDFLSGGGGDDTLDGGSGADTMDGSAGDDLFVVNAAGDVVIEGNEVGSDTIESTVTYMLPANVENLLLIGGASTNGTGNSADNEITGNGGDNSLSGGNGHDTLDGGSGTDTVEGGSGNDSIDGGLATDTLDGGSGNDIFVVNVAADEVIEESNGGNDAIYSAVTYTLPPHVENLLLTGSGSIHGTGNNAANDLTGNSGDNSLSGGAGNDTLSGGDGIDTINGDGGNDTLEGGGGGDELNGGAGNDRLDGGGGPETLIGGTGNDLYICDDTTLVMIEAAGEGIDAMMMTDGISAPDNIENMIYIGTADNIGFGANELDNLVTGNALNQTMSGNDGIDTISYAYETNAVIVDLENETASGSGDDNIFGFENAVGGAAGDTLIGNEVDNLLDGRGGVDTMEGGLGDDTYLVDDVDDTVVENDNGPAPLADDPAALDDFTDTVIAVVNYSLSNVDFVENLTLNGTATQGTGNGLNNIITGNDRANTLSGLGGNDTIDGSAAADALLGQGGRDTLYGRGGNDTLNGGTGADTFVFTAALNASTNRDRIADFTAGTDEIRLDNDVFTELDAGNLPASAFRSAPGAVAATNANHRIIYNENAGDLYYDADGEGGDAATRFATLTSIPEPTADDFFIVT